MSHRQRGTDKESHRLRHGGKNARSERVKETQYEGTNTEAHAEVVRGKNTGTGKEASRHRKHDIDVAQRQTQTAQHGGSFKPESTCCFPCGRDPTKLAL